MRILFAISIVCFLALAWATVAITRHVRRSTGVPLPESAGTPYAAEVGAAGTGAMSAPLVPNRAKPAKYTSGQRHDRTFSNKNSGDLKDPEARVSTRPRRKARR